MAEVCTVPTSDSKALSASCVATMLIEHNMRIMARQCGSTVHSNSPEFADVVGTVVLVVLACILSIAGSFALRLTIIVMLSPIRIATR